MNTNEQNYLIVRNHEEQYSIWPEGKELPAGWEIVGDPQSKDACLTRIEELWTDMRPASLRRRDDGSREKNSRSG